MIKNLIITGFFILFVLLIILYNKESFEKPDIGGGTYYFKKCGDLKNVPIKPILQSKISEKEAKQLKENEKTVYEFYFSKDGNVKEFREYRGEKVYLGKKYYYKDKKIARTETFSDPEYSFKTGSLSIKELKVVNVAEEFMKKRKYNYNSEEIKVFKLKKFDKKPECIRYCEEPSNNCGENRSDWLKDKIVWQILFIGKEQKSVYVSNNEEVICYN